MVATPIGNIDEINARALAVLSEADYIAAEDTRTTGLLLSRLRVAPSKFISYHKFNESARQELVLGKLEAGHSVALVSDAGTPCVSDPGYMLVRAAASAGFKVVGVSGSCAVILALSVSGLPAEPFVFVGFMPRKAVAEAVVCGTTMVFYESPKRIVATMGVFAEKFPEASICLCNDLTKKFEHIYRGSPGEVLEELLANPHAEKGEYTCVAYVPESAEVSISPISIEGLLIDTIVKSGCTITMKDAIKILSADYNKKEVYAASLRLKDMFL